MSRGGPGLGSISAAQSDYFQSTRGGGHGDYRTIVLALRAVGEGALGTVVHLDDEAIGSGGDAGARHGQHTVAAAGAVAGITRMAGG